MHSNFSLSVKNKCKIQYIYMMYLSSATFCLLEQNKNVLPICYLLRQKRGIVHYVGFRGQILYSYICSYNCACLWYGADKLDKHLGTVDCRIIITWNNNVRLRSVVLPLFLCFESIYRSSVSRRAVDRLDHYSPQSGWHSWNNVPTSNIHTLT